MPIRIKTSKPPGPVGTQETSDLTGPDLGGQIVDAVVILIVGAIHGQVPPRLIFSPPGTAIAATPADIPGRLAETILAGTRVSGRAGR